MLTLLCALFIRGVVADLQEDNYVFTSNRWSDNVKELPSLGNGHVGTVVKQSWVHMQGLYNGFRSQSHRAKIPSTTAVSYKGVCARDGWKGCRNLGFKWQRSTNIQSFSLDTKNGVFTEKHVEEGVEVGMQWYVHRIRHPIITFKLRINCTSGMKDKKYVVMLEVPQVSRSDDIDFVEIGCPFKQARCLKGTTRIAEDLQFSKRQTFYMLYEPIPGNITLSCKRQAAYFITSIHKDKSTAYNHFHLSRLLGKQKEEEDHKAGWRLLWEGGRVEVEGDEKVARTAVSSQYSLYSNLPFSNVFDDFVGLSPSGLSWGDTTAYQGHVFWDQELWMSPAVALFHPHMARLLLHTRLRTLDTAYYNAAMTNNSGVKFPWESALTGLETGPYGPCNQREIHINGDIQLAFKSYLASINTSPSFSVDELVGARTSNLIIGTADYWISKISHNVEKDRYEIKCVMPPDEYQECVSNSVYTNYIAVLSLQQAHQVASSLGFSNASLYSEVANKIYILFDSELNFHPEYEGFDASTQIKQADVILLNFPLMMPMPLQIKLNDLSTYEPLTDATGPAMSDSMYSVGWLSVGHPVKAHESFIKMFQHVCGDFQVWTESKWCHGAPNFITGMGGYLQALLYGYGGIRLHSDHLHFDPKLPYNTTSLSFYGIKYKGCDFDVVISYNSTVITCISCDQIETTAVFIEYKEGSRVYMQEGTPQKLEKRAGDLYIELH